MAALQAPVLRSSRVLTLQHARTAPLQFSPHGQSPHAARGGGRAATAPRAALGSSLLDTVFLGAAVAGLGLSALPLLTGEAREQNQSPTLDEDSDEADFEWGLSSVVSFLPYVNWTVRCNTLLRRIGPPCCNVLVTSLEPQPAGRQEEFPLRRAPLQSASGDTSFTCGHRTRSGSIQPILCSLISHSVPSRS